MSASHSEPGCQTEGDEIEFKFKLPKEGLAIQGVQLKDGVPVIRFQPSPNVPTVTEQDLAAACRLTYCDQTRPKFIFLPIPPGHPFWGRQYKYYSPQWMNGTGLGELLFEADWIMKCLMIGCRTNKEKTVFDAWENTSNLQGLASVWDFYEKEEPTDYTVYMSCETVKVSETNDELAFPEEPRIRIDVDNNPRYTDYITTHYNSVGYYDEPLLLKIREVPKLILIAEWLKQKGVAISTDWMMANTQKSPNARAIEKSSNLRNPPMADTAEYVKQVLQATQQQDPSTSTSALALPFFGFRFSPTKIVRFSDIKVVDDRLIQWEETRKQQLLLPWMPPVEIKRSVRASFDDFDRLYERLDPKQPLALDKSGLFCPPVKSWSELYTETVPWPCSWQVPFIGLSKPSAGGGVNMTSFATERVPSVSKTPVSLSEKVKDPSTCRPSVNVSEGGRRRKQKTRRQVSQYSQNGHTTLAVGGTSVAEHQPSTRPPSRLVPATGTFQRPSSDVRADTTLRTANQVLQQHGAQRLYGIHDGVTGGLQMHMKGGQQVTERRPLHIQAEETITMQGETVGRDLVTRAIPVPMDLNQSAPLSEVPGLSLELQNNETDLQASLAMQAKPNDLFSPTGSADSGYVRSPPNEPESSEGDPNEEPDPTLDLDECPDSDDK